MILIQRQSTMESSSDQTTSASPPQQQDTATKNQHHDDEKSHTFRKRRLTYAKHQLGAAATAIAAAAAAALHEEESEEEGQSFLPQHKKVRTDESPPKDDKILLESRVLHAGELMRRFSSPSSTPNHRLYKGPFAPADEEQHSTTKDDDKIQPAWKKRHTRHHHEKDETLPFPRHVVGTYSCHGMEPVYDSDYVQEDDDEDDDEDWVPEGTTAPKKAEKKEEPPPSKQQEATTQAAKKEPDKPDKLTAKINQDRACVAFPYGNCARTAIFGAFDGHGQGGELVSQFAVHEVPRRLEIHPDFERDVEKAFKETFRDVDFALTEESLIEPLYAGTTACVALLRDNVLSIANAGDSRAVLGRKSSSNHKRDGVPTTWEAHDLTQDQNPDLPEEQARIEKAGGYVSAPPEEGLSARVWLDCSFSMIGLAMSRSIGDHAVKTVGVISEPVVTTHTVSPDDDFMIIATDGVWEFVSSQEAVDIVSKTLEAGEGSTKACQKLIEASAAKWHDEEGDYRDDITAVVVRLQELWENSNVQTQQEEKR